MVRALLIVWLAAAVTACGSGTAPRERKGQIISLTDTTLDAGGSDTVRFGQLRSGEIAVLQLWIANDASRAVALTGYDRTCGCTSLEFDNQPIAPQGAQQVKLSFDSRGERGWQLKVVDLTFAGARKPLRIFVEADVE